MSCERFKESMRRRREKTIEKAMATYEEQRGLILLVDNHSSYIYRGGRGLSVCTASLVDATLTSLSGLG